MSAENPIYRRLNPHRSVLMDIQLLAAERRNLLRTQLETADLSDVPSLQGQIEEQKWWSNIISRIESAIDSPSAKKDG